jgi:hypothetical protein
MADQYRGKTTDELVSEIDAAWQRMLETMTSHPAEAYVTKRDQVGWTPLDHLAHVTAWERTALYPLKGVSRHEALGVTEEQFLMDEDALNQIVRQQSAGDSWDVTMAKARAAHAELVETLRAAKVEDLWRPTLALSPDTREVPVIELLMDDGCEHFDQHREYIERILAG